MARTTGSDKLRTKFRLQMRVTGSKSITGQKARTYNAWGLALACPLSDCLVFIGSIVTQFPFFLLSSVIHLIGLHASRRCKYTVTSAIQALTSALLLEHVGRLSRRYQQVERRPSTGLTCSGQSSAYISCSFTFIVTSSQLQYEARSRLLLESAAISIESACVAHEEYVAVRILPSYECRVWHVLKRHGRICWRSQAENLERKHVAKAVSGIPFAVGCSVFAFFSF